MDKNIIIVPKGIRYISEWSEFSLKDFAHVVDKKIPGCGFTEFCLTNNMDLILVCPRKMLLENKRDQHKEDVYLVQSLMTDIGVDKDLTSKKPSKITVSQIIEKIKKKQDDLNIKTGSEEYIRLKNEIDDYIVLRRSIGKPAKILVTYDSYRKIKNILEDLGLFDQFYTVVDEFQSIFVDSKFKSDIEMEFMNTLQDVTKLCYVSATPMLDEYLDKIDEFKDLPYYELDWSTEDPGRANKPNFKTKIVKSIIKEARNIIKDYKSKNFEVYSRRLPDGSIEEVVSREAVFYMNSINNISQTIKAEDLNPEEVNILCANTSENLKRIKSSLGNGFEIGKVPLKDEPRKMFTFCTRTVYLGADFYSDNARSFVMSDANIDSMAVDITLDLPQILGRQRLESNPWKNSAHIYVKCLLPKNQVGIDSFKDWIDHKIVETKNLLSTYDRCVGAEKHTLASRYLKLAHAYNYAEDYVAVNCHNESDMVPVFNNLAMVAEQRAYDIQQLDYADRFIVFNKLEESFGLSLDSDIQSDKFISEFNQFNKNYDRMKYLCSEGKNLHSGVMEKILSILSDDPKTSWYSNYYRVIGPDRIRSLGYDMRLIKSEYEKQSFPREKLSIGIYQTFKEGEKYSKSDIKINLKTLYDTLNYNSSAKATDIEEWFEVKSIKLKDPMNKWIHGYELISKKQQ